MSDKLSNEERAAMDLPFKIKFIERETELDRLRRENERLRHAISNLEPIMDVEWHGKWRVQKALEALEPNQHKHSVVVTTESHKIYLDETSREMFDLPPKHTYDIGDTVNIEGGPLAGEYVIQPKTRESAPDRCNIIQPHVKRPTD